METSLKLKENKSCGHDEIPPKLVKKVYSKYIIKPTYIHNQSFLTGSIPDDLKVALVTPVFKANDKEEFSNLLQTYLCAPMFQQNIRETNYVQ